MKMTTVVICSPDEFEDKVHKELAKCGARETHRLLAAIPVTTVSHEDRTTEVDRTLTIVTEMAHYVEITID